jgi:hypothetical protein
MDQFVVNTRCGGVAAYIEGYDKFDGKFNAVVTCPGSSDHG